MYWSPNLLKISKAQNIYKLNEKTALNLKMSTYEGPEYLAPETFVHSPALKGRIKKACNSIIEHLKIVTGGSVEPKKMILVFKIDQKERVWLSYCEELNFRKVVNYLNEKMLDSKAKYRVMKGKNRGYLGKFIEERKIKSPKLKLAKIDDAPFYEEYSNFLKLAKKGNHIFQDNFDKLDNCPVCLSKYLTHYKIRG